MRRIRYPRGYQSLRAGRILRADSGGPGTPAPGEVTETREAPRPAATVRSHPMRVAPYPQPPGGHRLMYPAGTTRYRGRCARNGPMAPGGDSVTGAARRPRGRAISVTESPQQPGPFCHRSAGINATIGGAVEQSHLPSSHCLRAPARTSRVQARVSLLPRASPAARPCRPRWHPGLPPAWPG